MGWHSLHVHLGDDATQADVLAAIREMNDAADVDAFLVQHPAPPHIDYDAALMTVDPDKDVDGMHPLNMGRLALGVDGPIPCTPAGIEALLAHYEMPVAGRNVVHPGPGRSPSAGRSRSCCRRSDRPRTRRSPWCTPASPDWPEYTRRADIVVAAAGVPGILQPEHLTPGAWSWAAASATRAAAAPRRRRGVRGGRGRITPRVGGVGPTTIAMLFRNLVECAERRAGVSERDVPRSAAPGVIRTAGVPRLRVDRGVRCPIGRTRSPAASWCSCSAVSPCSSGSRCSSSVSPPS